MSKVITLRLSDEEYQRIFSSARVEHRPISNFITTVVLQQIESSLYTDAVESAQILSDKKLMGRLAAGHTDAKHHKGRFV